LPNILVTGGAGYVGSVCCAQLLEQGHTVTVVDNLSTGHREAVPHGAQLVVADIGDRSAIAKILSTGRFDAIFHFAAKSLISESMVNPGIVFDCNVAASIALLEMVRTAGIKRFVLSSTAAVYGNPATVPIDENDSKNPVNPYGESKLMLERALQWYAATYGWTVVAFRYFNASGATQSQGEDHRPETHLIPLLLQVASGDRKFIEVYGTNYDTPDGTCLRDYIHVSDIAEAHLLALKTEPRPGMSIYNIGTGISHSVKQLIDVVETVTGKHIDTKESPRREGDPAVLCASPRRLTETFGWKPAASDLRQIVESAWRWKRSHPNGY
jgi:UDP-glucose 4-epimerase